MVMAQGPRRGGQDMDPKTRAERMTERMAKEYSLNETQKKELFEVNMAFVQKMGERPGRMKPEMRQGKKGQSQATDSCTCKQDRRKAPRMSKEDREKMRQEMKASRESYEAGLKKNYDERPVCCLYQEAGRAGAEKRRRKISFSVDD